MSAWTRGEYLELAGIVVTSLVAIAIYKLQERLSDKQRVDHRLEIEAKAGQKINDIQDSGHSAKVQLYNAKLINKKYFSQNQRSILWGYPYHAAELRGASFDGLEFVIGIEGWNKKKYHKVGVIPYENILGIKPDGDGSFNGMIIYVKPRLLQRDKYSIAYKTHRYYEAKPDSIVTIKKPLGIKFLNGIKKAYGSVKYHSYYRWKHKIVNKKKLKQSK